LPTLTDAPLLGMAGDITPFWYGELHTAWRQTPVAIAGVTEAGPLFCLEQLGREHGLRVAWRSAVPQQPLVAWLLVPAKTV
ncbi:MAG TPA: hypothetical protein VMH83_10170, partial [Candidatus Acidoferrum sp.]|nr:hypothetical protein [Candidatus Acidoferrum sp.]